MSDLYTDKDGNTVRYASEIHRDLARAEEKIAALREGMARFQKQCIHQYHSARGEDDEDIAVCEYCEHVMGQGG